MGLINKLKNILFEEEEVEIPVIEKKEKKEVVKEETFKEMPKNNMEVKNRSFYEDLEPVIQEEKKIEEKNSNIERESVSERELFKAEKTFNFPAFDEEEFESMAPRTKLRPTNILEREKKEKKEQYRTYERKEETPEKTKFRPSPIISPVYGILDKNYTPDEITSRTENEKLDVDSVRKKAFGVKEEVKEETVVLDDKVLEEKLEKARTIDELLQDSSDDVISLDKEEEPVKEEIKEEVDLKEDHEDDTLESDLFDLIDSMYENREDGE